MPRRWPGRVYTPRDMEPYLLRSDPNEEWWPDQEVPFSQEELDFTVDPWNPGDVTEHVISGETEYIHVPVNAVVPRGPLYPDPRWGGRPSYDDYDEALMLAEHDQFLRARQFTFTRDVETGDFQTMPSVEPEVLSDGEPPAGYSRGGEPLYELEDMGPEEANGTVCPEGAM